MITSTLSICSHDARVLYDPGFTHSYVLPYFAKYLGKDPKRLSDPFLVATPLGESLVVEYVYWSCTVFPGEK